MYVRISPNNILYVHKLNSIDRASHIGGEEMNVTLFRIKKLLVLKWNNIVHVIY